MLTILLFQVLPPLLLPAKELPTADATYFAEVMEMGQRETLSKEILMQARPQYTQEVQALRQVLRQGNHAQRRTAILLGKNILEPSWHTELLRAALKTHDEGTSLMAVLAWKPSADADPSVLAYLAADPTRTLTLRAAACAGLLRAGCTSAWPLARTILKLGTGQEEDAPWVTWRDPGKYELPKRILVLALDELGQAHGLSRCGIEPNGAWKDQLAQIAAWEEKSHSKLPALLRKDSSAVPGAVQLFRRALEGDAVSEQALFWLYSMGADVVKEGLASKDFQCQQLARRLIRVRPQ
ncbi:MAG: hypothetical protein OTJ44_02845 [Planctomycetota bacterium]|nr:hypothetical protein [Planctomycetota bacterium]